MTASDIANHPLCIDLREIAAHSASCLKLQGAALSECALSNNNMLLSSIDKYGRPPKNIMRQFADSCGLRRMLENLKRHRVQ